MDPPTAAEMAELRIFGAVRRLRDPERRMRVHRRRDNARMAILARVLKNQTRHRWASRVLAPRANVNGAVVRFLLELIHRWPRDHVAQRGFDWTRPRLTQQDCCDAFMTLNTCTVPRVDCRCEQCAAAILFACAVAQGHPVTF
jgi:hypothetical protein